MNQTWDFAAGGALLGWSPTAPVSNFGASNGGLTFSATPQVTMLNGPATSVPAAALERVEILMSSDTAGAAKVFWAPAPSGPDNGFQAGDENDFVLVGDGAFHHYYLPLNTSSASTIYGLRLMVPPGATVTIKSLSLASLSEPSGTGVSPSWQFNVDGDTLGWIPYEGAVDMSVSGGRLRISAYSNATILGPKAQVTNQLEWFSLFGSVSQSSLETPWVQFNYLSAANHGISTSVYFPVVADLADRVYNQNVGGASGWSAGISQLSISVPENTTLAISQIQVSAAPQGPADLALDSCGPVSQVAHAGTQFQISCRVSNRGAQPVQQVSVNLNVPTGVTIISRPAISGSLRSGYPQTLVWTLVSNWNGNLTFSVSLGAPTGESAQITSTILVTPPVQTQISPYVPLPVPVSSNYDVGVYYFPGWKLDSHWDPIRAFPERTPLLGHYAEGDPQVMDWQIKWAVEHGVKFFAADWSWFGPGMPASEQGEQPNSFLQGYASSVYHGYVQFCLSYAGNQPAAIAGSVSELLTITQTWIDKYFPRVEYYRIGKMPVIIVRNPDILAANLGGSAKPGLDAARQLAKAAGFNGIYFIAATSDVAQPSDIQVSQLLADGYDALSGYSLSRAGSFDPAESPYSTAVSGLPSLWDAYIAASTIPYILPASPGFDLRAWAAFSAPNEIVRTGSNATQFEQMLQQARTRIDAGKAPPVVLIEGWNQFGEGSYVEPTVGRGFAYLDAIRNAFTGNTPHTDLSPSDAGLPLITTSPSGALLTFTDPSDLTPWQAAAGQPLYNWSRNISNSKIANKQWTFTANGNADLARMGFQVPAQNYQGVAIRMAVSADTNVSVYWGAADEPGLSVLRNTSFTAKAGPIQTYTLTLNNNPGWRGIINLLRLTTSNSSNVDMAIESIEFLSSSPAAAIAVSRMQSQFDWNIGGPLPAPQTISIASATGSGLSWTAASNASWLTVSPAAGTGATSLTLSVNPTALAIGAYAAVVTISSPGASNDPQTIPVSLSIMPPAPGFSVPPPSPPPPPPFNFIGSMAHIAALENWTTSFTLVNKSSASAQARLSAFGDPAGTLTLPWIFPQLPAAPSPLMAASIDRTILANASLIIQTAGAQVPPVQMGSAQLSATGAVDGFAILHHVVTGQEAAVPMETRTAPSYLLAFDNTAGRAMGVALENVSAQAANIPVVIRDDSGKVISPPGVVIPMAANGHIAFMLSDLPQGFPVTANKRGTIEFDTPPGGGKISALGLRFTQPNNAFTTIPVLANVGTGGGSIAHFASGGDGWQTTFVLVNTGASAANATLKFFADDGTPLVLPLAFPQFGGSTTAVSSITQTLASGATLVLDSSGAAALLTGSAQLSTTGNIGGFVIFRHNDQEAAAPWESRNAGSYVLAFDNTQGTAHGIAINSVSSQTVSIPVVVRDDTGAQIATDTLQLPPNGHLAFTLAVDKYLKAAGLRGTIEFTTPKGAQIGVFGLRVSSAHTFTALPILAK